jgi:hypothetical protein
MAVGRLTQLVFECDDAVALARFWQQVLDLPEPPERRGPVEGGGAESRSFAGGSGRDREAGGRTSVVGDACEWSVVGDACEWSVVASEERPEWVTLEWEPVGRFSFHRCQGYVPPRWPGGCGEHQVHFDLLVEDLAEACGVVEKAGGRPLTPILDPGPKEWRIYADPAGHPFCLVTVPE